MESNNALESNEPIEEECCAICGDSLSKKFVYKLPCNHEFHYECIFKTLVACKSTCNKCPYCRQSFEILEPVNGLKGLKYGIHFKNYDNVPEYTNITCDHIMTRGKNKGNKCGKNCQLGYYKCGLHNKPKLIDKGNKGLETNNSNVTT